MPDPLKDALAQIQREYGKGSIMRLGDEDRVDVEAIPTDAITLDMALGIGGIPRGRLIELYGPEATGKTTLAYHLAANAQQIGPVAFIDTEHGLDPAYAERIGVNVDDLIVSQPTTAEDALNIMDKLVTSGSCSLVVLDSVAGLVPRTELEGEMGEATVGLLARLMSQACRKLAGKASKTDTTVLFTNQIREKIGVTWGSPEVQPGGRALKFWSSQRLDIRRVETIKKNGEAVANRVRVTVKKNRMAAPFRQADFDIEYGTGISREGCLIDLGLECGLVTKSGAHFSYGEARIGHGREATKTFLTDNPELADALEEAIRAE